MLHHMKITGFVVVSSLSWINIAAKIKNGGARIAGKV